MSKPINKLTDSQIRKFTTDKNTKLADGGGLALLVKPNGSKWWRFNYRQAGKHRTISMGTYRLENLLDC